MKEFWKLPWRFVKVYVYLKNGDIVETFLKDAEKAGLTFIDGTKPTERERDNYYRINENGTINYVGWAGHMMLGTMKKDVVVGDKILIDYSQLVLERERTEHEKEIKERLSGRAWEYIMFKED